MCEAHDPARNSSSLDALETSSSTPSEDLSPLAADNPQQRRLHARDGWRRSKIVECLHHAGDTDGRRSATRIAECSRYPLVCGRADGSLFVAAMRCKHRLCPTCGRLRSHQVADAITAAVKRMNAPRFITLTQIADESSWERAYAKLTDAFRVLRSRKRWKDRVRGGIYAIETTYNPRSRRWHVHLHCVVDGGYFPQKVLSDEWAIASKGSRIVDIRAVHDRSATARYVAKYVGKPAQPEAWPADRICEYANQSKGKRTWHTFGSLHGCSLKHRHDDDVSTETTVLCGTQRLLADARKGDAASKKAVMLISKLGHFAAKAVGIEVSDALLWFRPLEEHERKFIIETCAIVATRHDAIAPEVIARHERKTQLRLERARQLMLHAPPP